MLTRRRNMKIDQLVKSGRGSRRFLNMTDTPKTTLFDPTDETGGYTDPVVNPVTPSKPVSGISNPEVEIDFSTLSCSELESKIAWLKNLFTVAKMTSIAVDYYQNKLSQAQAAYAAKCGGGDGIIQPTMPPDKPSGTGTVSTPTGTTVNIGNDAITGGLAGPNGAFAPAPGGSGGGGGGGAGSSNKKDSKKNNWWWWLLAAGVVGLCLYKGRNTSIKLPG